jgi:hypothetical protein
VRRAALMATVPIAVAGLVATAPAAHADHVHFVVTGAGCVLLAPDGGEKYVQLPHADEFAANRQHPLHVNVHLGRPGEVQPIYVAYTADGTLTQDAWDRCGGEFVNR